MRPLLKIKRLTETARLPCRMSEEAAAFDIYTDETRNIWKGDIIKIHTGVAIEIPKGYHAELHIRSSWGMQGIHLANCTGIIDSDYRGEILLYVHNYGDGSFFIPEGTRLAQMILVKDTTFDVKEVEELSETTRGIGGFGSTNH